MACGTLGSSRMRCDAKAKIGSIAARQRRTGPSYLWVNKSACATKERRTAGCLVLTDERAVRKAKAELQIPHFVRDDNDRRTDPLLCSG
jgi:hypothetical protein